MWATNVHAFEERKIERESNWKPPCNTCVYMEQTEKWPPIHRQYRCRFDTHPIFDALRFSSIRCLSVCCLHVCVCRVYPVHIALCVYLSHFFSLAFVFSSHKPPVLVIRKLFERAWECLNSYCIWLAKSVLHLVLDTVFNACLCGSFSLLRSSSRTTTTTTTI